MLGLREALTLEIQGYNKVDSERDPYSLWLAGEGGRFPLIYTCFM